MESVISQKFIKKREANPDQKTARVRARVRARVTARVAARVTARVAARVITKTNYRIIAKRTLIKIGTFEKIRAQKNFRSTQSGFKIVA